MLAFDIVCLSFLMMVDSIEREWFLGGYGMGAGVVVNGEMGATL